MLTAVPYFGKKLAQNINALIPFWVDTKFHPDSSVSHIDRGTYAGGD
jgi:hypothetical protein